ncbi:3'-5' exonuclease [Nocardioides panacisoli]|uniref:3'-5' exonuclease n=1 Tax=Nocardioides panacisoli TaxID=627624 RepID=UPI001C630B83|nr:exonuclease domain-containing protein [Nocardioides panacisoli]QYJ03379.1 3'-5' exonuclease [Nocardioides panacisoli]
MRAPTWWRERQRRRLAARTEEPVVRRHLAQAPPDDRTPLAELRLLAVDLETTGLDPQRDEILSVGWVPIDAGRVVLSGAEELLVRPSGDVGASATIHGLTDDAVAAGTSPADALAVLLPLLEGRVLVAHHSALDVGFLQAAARRLSGVTPPIASVCTLELERRDLDRRGVQLLDGTLRLPESRRRHGLPDAPLHTALGDAVACAELYLAQAAAILDADPRATLAAVRRH